MRRLSLILAGVLFSIAATTAELRAQTLKPPESAPVDPMAAARAPRHALRNGQDYLGYGEYDRALAFFREAESRLGELTLAERVAVRDGIDAARRGLRQVEPAAPAVARAGGRRASARSRSIDAPVGAIALAEPVPAARPGSTDGVVLTGGERVVAPIAAGSVGLPPRGPVEPPPLSQVPMPAGSPEAPAPLGPVVGVEPSPPPALEAIAPPLMDPAVPIVTQPVAMPSLSGVPRLPADPSRIIGTTDEVAVPEEVAPLVDDPSATPEPPPLPDPAGPGEQAPPTPPERVPAVAAGLDRPMDEPSAAPELPAVVVVTPETPPASPAPAIAPEELPPLPPPADQVASLVEQGALAAAPRSGIAQGPGPDFGVADGEAFLEPRRSPYPSALSPDLEREVDQIARRQETDRSRSLSPSETADEMVSEPTDDGSGLSSSSVELPRAPSPTEARPIQSIPVPEEFTTMTPRRWSGGRKYWAAAATCHGPLYFQDAALERYGISAEQRLGPLGRCLSYPLDDPTQTRQRNQIAQPFLSAGRFAGQILAFPYNVLMDPPGEAEYDLGYYRPGDAVPPDTVYMPHSGVGPPLRGKHY